MNQYVNRDVPNDVHKGRKRTRIEWKHEGEISLDSSNIRL
jgi:hypothetical protein